MTLYLRVLAACDLCVLYTGLLVSWVLVLWGVEVRSAHGVVCKLGVWLLNACAVSSPWLLVLVTLQRAASVIWPHRLNASCTRGRTITALVSILLLVGLLYSHLLYGFDLVSTGTVTYCSMGSRGYKAFMDGIWLRIDMWIYSLLPFTLLVISNGVLIVKLTKAVKAAGAKLTTVSSDQVSSRRKKASATSVTLISVSTTFVVLTLPITVKNVVFSLYNSDVVSSLQPEHIALRSFVDAFCYMLVYWNYAINFYVYCLTGTKFRLEFLKLVCFWRRRRSELDSSVITGTTHLSGISSSNPTSAGGTAESDDF